MSEESTNEAVDRVEVEIEAEADEVQFDRETLSDYLSMSHRC